MHQIDTMHFTVACVNNSIVSIVGRSRAGERQCSIQTISKDDNQMGNSPKGENENSKRGIPTIRLK